MAIELGKVERINHKWIELRVAPSEGCLMCHSKMSCSFHGPDSAYGHVKIPYQSGIDVGDRVTFETKESAQNISALIIFGLPILLILTGYFVVTQFFNIPYAELWGVFSGIFVYGILLIVFNKWFSKLPMFLPKIMKVEKTKVQEQSEIGNSN
jgi:positive regulator of sigma E activity